MEILDPDLWNDDGTPKRPSQQYMRSLEEAQDLEALNPEIEALRAEERRQAMARYRTQLLMDTKPTIGDVVHFRQADGVCRAAIVMEIENHVATLRVHIPHEPFQDWEADHSESLSGGTWHWPETAQ